MKNTEFVIHLVWHNRRDTNSEQSFRRDAAGWTQTSSRGIVRPCTAEQVLNHLLPALLPASPIQVIIERVAPETPPGGL